MKNFVQLLFIIVVFSLSSCSSVPERFPAEAQDPLFEAVFTIPKSDMVGEKSFEKNIMDELTAQEIRVSALDFRIDVIESKTLPAEVAYKIELAVDPKKSELVYKIFRSADSFNDPVASYSLADYMSHLVTTAELNSPFSTFELYHNAKAGDPIALEAFYKIRTSEHHFIDDEAKTYFESASFKKSRDQIQKLRPQVTKQVKALKAKRTEEREQRKLGLAALDKAPEGKQFRIYIAKGDRKNAAEVLRKYLPWEEMAPFEKQFWSTYLDVIEHPVPLEERVLIYRGIDDDFIHKAYTGTKELSTNEAIKENKAFVMSSIMTKNQGSWNRRLRSLEAMNNKFIGTINDTSEFTQSARITTMFLNHSANPKGSPFLSFSPSFSVAEDFGNTRLSSYLFDPRLLNFNYTSAFEEEIEFLVPLTTFPDELVGIADTNLDPKGEGMSKFVFLDDRLEKLIAEKYAERKDEVLAKIKRNTYDFFKAEYENGLEPSGKNFGKSNIKFYKNFLTIDEPRPVLTPEGDLGCKDLIELFWVAN